jgi:hypothetical protein
MRPDRATNVYAQRCREAFPGVPVIAGGVEASLRRIAHLDSWSETVRPSILVTSKAGRHAGGADGVRAVDHAVPAAQPARRSEATAAAVEIGSSCRLQPPAVRVQRASRRWLLARGQQRAG